ncbi:MAG: M48 family metallopeptidase [Clostridia bacterium]|nr:M48 family metallopeptidase [Clostridia bacterium]
MKLLIIGLFTAAFLYRIFLTLLERRSFSNPIPENVKDVYDAETYEKWRGYKKEKLRTSLYAAAVGYIADMLLLIFNVYAWAASLFAGNVYNELFAVTLLSAIAGLITDIGFSWYDDMVTEQKYGFNRTDQKTFIADQAKSFLISLGLMTGLTCALAGIHIAMGDGMLLLFTAVLFLFGLLFSFLYPVFSRIFNKFTDLEDGELRGRLTSLLEKNGYKVRAIRVMDASRRSTKSNAYFTGFGKMKTIVLYDTLLDTMDADEICAVFAHEMGHGLHKDTLKNQLLSLISMFLLAFLLWVCLRTPKIYTAFGFSGVNYGFAVIVAVSVGMGLVSPLWGLLTSWHSRRAEYRADAQAVKEGYGPALVSALRKLTRGNFGDLSPSPLLVKLTYSHPPLSQRIAAIEKVNQ